MSKQAQKQRNLANRQLHGKRRKVTVKTYVVKNVGTRKTLTVLAADVASAKDQALANGLAKSVEKLVVV